MAWILDQFGKLQGRLQRAVASSDPVDPPPSKRARIVESSSQVPPPSLPEEERLLASSSRTNPLAHPRPRKINDNVHEVHKPAGRPSVEMVFYHGLQLVGADESHLTTWLSGKGTALWLNWLLEDFQDARILTISYDAHAQKTDEQGRMDMYVTCENLVASLLDAQIGQDGCPVVFVGHCIGGLIMKELCVRANSDLALNALDKHQSPVQNLLHNVQGFFSYASPHHGSTLADSSTWFSKGPLFEGITTLNTEAARRNEEFRKLRSKYKWKAVGVGEARPITLGTFEGLVVEEGSARQDVDTFYTVAADHFHVCRPDSPESSSFSLLRNFVQDILKEDKALRDGHKVELSAEVVGLDDKVKGILAMHKDTRRLGIVGMGGIGKTTLAKSIYNTISGSYEYTCFLPEVKKTIMADEENPGKLRKLIIGSLFHQGRKVDSTNFDWDTLKGKTVLIVLDDAESESQVLGIADSDGFSCKSLVVVTARDRGFLIPEMFECHFAEKLGNMNSTRIFCVHAFNQWNAPAGYEEQVARFTQECDGLPLALKVVGKYLYKRDKSLWDDAFVKLSRAQSLNGDAKDRLFSILRICVDSLAEAEREMFLDVAVCFHAEELAAVKRAWSVFYPAINSGWENLVDRGLVTTERRSWSERTVIQMHEILRDLGRRMAYQDSENIAGHSRVVKLSELRCGEFLHNSIPRPWNEVLHDLDRQLLFHEGISKAKVLRIDGSVMDVNLPGQLHELRILWVDTQGRSRLHGQLHKLPSRLLYLRVSRVQDWIEVSEETSPSPEDLQLHGTLQQFEIVDCDWLKTLPRSLGQLSALTHLRIVGCQRLRTLPESLGRLRALKHLHIEDCDSLETLPCSVGQLQVLESLHIESCSPLRIFPSSFSKLRSLKYLFIEGCPALETFPCSLDQFQVLESLHIQSCTSLRKFPCSFSTLRSLKYLFIKGCPALETFPCSFDQFQVLESLHIQSCTSLRKFPCSFSTLRSLKYLFIEYCPRLETFPCSFDQFQVLESLHIKNCHAFLIFPSSFSKLRSLKYLFVDYLCQFSPSGPLPFFQVGNIIRPSITLTYLSNILQQLDDFKHLYTQRCGNFEVVRVTLGQFEDIKALTINACEDVKALANCLGQLRALTHLRIVFSDILESLPYTLGQLQALEELEIEECGSLKTLPDTTGQVRNLRPLEILGCDNLETLPSTLGQLEALEELEIGNCVSLKTLPDTTGQLLNLRRLEILGCYNLETLPSTLGQLQALEELKIRKCVSLTTLPNTTGQLRNLRRLEILGCDNLETLPSTLGQLHAVEELKIEKCVSLRTLPDTTGELQNLRRLEILGCDNLETLPSTLGQLQALEELKIEKCVSLTTLLDTTSQLRNLRRLQILGCNSLETLSNTLGQLQALEELETEKCVRVTTPNTTGQLRNRRRLEILQCSSLETLLNAGQLEGLEELKIEECGSLTTLPDNIGQLGNLRCLEILGCSSLETLPSTLGQLQALEELKIEKCVSLTTLPDTTGQLRNLRYLKIMDCNSLETLPNTFGQLQALQKLVIYWCDNFKTLPDTFSQLKALEVLEIRFCWNLEILPVYSQLIPTLKRESLQRCSLEILS